MEELNYALNQILDLYISELGVYIKPEKLKYIRHKQKTGNIIKFKEDITGAYCDGRNIVLGAKSGEIINNLASNSKYYGKSPHEQLVKDDKFVDCKKDYLDYLKWFILTGKKPEDFYFDVLPHEAMHLIGVNGGALGEGVTERRTREICHKNNIRCVPVFHTKECGIIGLMEKIVGKEVTTRMGFSSGPYRYKELDREIDKNLGKDSFLKIFTEFELPYRKVYLNTEYKDFIERFKAYRELDFSKVEELLQRKEIEKGYTI